MASFKRISQTTFDDVVRENVEDFDMEASAALKDAIDQFVKQGVDLSKIDLTGGVGRQEMLDAMKALKEISVPCNDVENGLLILNTLSKLCDKSNSLSKRNLMLINEGGGVNDLHLHLVPKENRIFQLEVLKFITELSAEENIRDFFEPGGSNSVCELLLPMRQTSWEADDIEFIDALLTLSRVVLKTERNKNALMKGGMGSILTDMIVSATSDSSKLEQYTTVIEKSCHVLRGLSIHDDYRSEMSCAFDNGKFFLKQASLVPSLMQIINLYRTHVNIATAALLAIKAMITTNDAVQVICLHGMIECAIEVLTSVTSNKSNAEDISTQFPVPLIRAVIAVLRNIAADDLKKEQYITQGGLEHLVYVMNSEPYVQDSALMEHSLGCLAQFSLRSPSNSIRIMNTNVAIPVVIKSMRKFIERESLQRQGCLLIRNIAGRCPELRGVLLDAGIEPVLRDAGKFRGVVDEAYSALRDLGCEVQYVKVTEDGSVAPVYEQFGANSNRNFRPIYDEAEDMNQRMVDESRPPLRNFDHDHFHIDHDDEDCGCEDH